jgi:hypothetical protein
MADQSNSQFPFAAIAVAAAFVSSVWFTQRPLELTRPAEPDRYRYDFDLGREVDARLWEDPFAAAYRGLEQRKNERGQGAGAPPLPRVGELLAPVTHGEAEPLPRAQTVIIALLPGNPFVGGEELRRRARYAILSGLRAEGWAPRTPEYLGVAVAAAISDTAGQPHEVKLPFEYLIAGQTGIQAQTLLLWLDEAQVQNRRFDRLAHLAAQLFAKVPAPQRSAIRLAVVGPSSSSGLRNALSDLKHSEACAPGQLDMRCEGYRLLFAATFVNAAATAPAHRVIGDGSDRPPGPRGSWVDPSQQWETDAQSIEAELRLQFKRVLGRGDADTEPGPSYRSTVATDDTVARAMVAEMRARGIGQSGLWQMNDAPAGGQARVVVVAEWDSFYAKQFFDELDQAAQTAQELASSDGQRTLRPLRFDRYSYFRGTDGVSERQDKNSSRPTGGTGATGVVEWPEGADQRDYLRRLAGQLRRSERDGGGSIEAFVLIGSDVHDKLMILQALREEFADKSFFTSDFDVRFLHPRMREFTRNVVVVSAYGAQVGRAGGPANPTDARPDVVKGLPFRDSGQVALFRAARLAARPHGEDPANRIEPLPCLRLREMGRSGLLAHDVPWSATEGPQAKASGAQTPGCQRAATDRGTALVLLPFGVALVALLLWPSTPALKRLRAHLALHHRNRRRAAPLRHRPRWWGDDRGAILAAFLGLHVAALLWFACSAVEMRWPGHVTVERAAGLCALAVAAAWLAVYPGAAALRNALAHKPNAVPRVLASAIVLLLIAGAVLSAYGWTTPADTTHEPVRWLDGVSGWPAQTLVAGAIILSVAILDAAWYGIDRSATVLARRLFGGTQARLRERPSQAGTEPTARRWQRLVRAALVLSWPRAVGGSQYFEHVWLRYRLSGRPLARLARVAVLTVASGLLFWVVFAPLTEGYRLELPVRGADHRALMGWTQLAAVAAFLVLANAVCEATIVCCLFIRALDRGRSIYPEVVLERAAARLGGADRAAWLRRIQAAPELRAEPATDGPPRHSLLDDWIDIQVLGERTTIIAALVIGPFVVLTLLMFARSRLFDGFALTSALVALFVLALVILTSVAVALKIVAEQARQRSLTRMREDLRWLRGAGEPWSALERKFEALIAEVGALRKGAFAPFFDQPLVRAILVPLTGASGIQVFEYLLLAK